MLEDKIAGKEVVSAAGAEQGNIIDLMDALKKSIEQTKASGKKTGRKKVSEE